MTPEQDRLRHLLYTTARNAAWRLTQKDPEPDVSLIAYELWCVAAKVLTKMQEESVEADAEAPPPVLAKLREVLQ